VFPDDYFQEELRGKEVAVSAKIHKIFRSLHVTSLEEVKLLNIYNHYGFSDLDQLREQNEILYYLALRATDPTDLLKKPSHFLALVHRYTKLGKRDEVRRLGALLSGKPTALNALADTLAASGKCPWALEYYQALSDSLPSSVLKRVRCLLAMEEPDRAMRLLETTPETPDLEYQETLLGCLKAADPESSRIPSLEHHVLDLRIKAALAREAAFRGGAALVPPIIHGWHAEETTE
jgi:hypothetical protein